MDTATASAAGKAALKYVQAAIRKDQANRYSLLEDWRLPPVRRDLPAYEDEAFIVAPRGDGLADITVKAYASTADDPKCDGCSLSPDRPAGLDFVPGALVHDRWYDRLEALADGLGISIADCRKLGDEIFASVNLAENAGKPLSRTLSTVYYWGVRLFGGIYHGGGRKAVANAVKIILAAAIAASLSGCGGCVSSVFDGDGDGYSSPHYEQVEGGE